MLPSGGSHCVAAFPSPPPREPELKIMLRLRPAMLPGSHDPYMETAICALPFVVSGL